MKKRTIITFIGVILLVLILKNILGNEKDEAIAPTTTRTAKIVQTEVVGKGTFSEQVHVTGRVAADKEVTISTQWTGFIGSFLVDIGDKVTVGQPLATIADTYGFAGNALSTASLGVTGAELARDNALLSLNQAVASTQIAFEKAQKDFDAAQLNARETLDQAERNAAALQTGTTESSTTAIPKAQLDLNNYIASQQKQLDAFETSYANQLQNFQSFLANVIDMTDTLLGVSDQNKTLNDSYEYLLSATDSQQKVVAEELLRKLLAYKKWSPDPALPLLDRVIELQKAHTLVNSLLASVETVLINSVSDASVFPPATLATHRATVDAYQSQYSGISTALVSFLNTAQTFLATYRDERLAREQAVKIAADNAKNTLAQTKISVENSLRAASSGLELAKNAYEAAQKAQQIGASQVDQSVSLASLRLNDAQGSAARLTVTAPFSGVIIARNFEIGSLVSPGANIFTLGDSARLVIKTDVSVEQRTYLAEGQDIPLIFDGKTFYGTLSSLSAGPDPVTHLYRVEITLTLLHPQLTLWDIIDVVLPGAPLSQNPEDTEIVIPYTALRNLGQETYAVYVMTIEDEKKQTGTLHERIIKIGKMNETSVTIIEWLSVWERIVTIGTLGVDDGDYAQIPFDPSNPIIPSAAPVLAPAVEGADNAKKDF